MSNRTYTEAEVAAIIAVGVQANVDDAIKASAEAVSEITALNRKLGIPAHDTSADLASLLAAERTLKSKGYTYQGGEYWKPPVGPAPNFDLLDATRATARADALREAADHLRSWPVAEEAMLADECAAAIESLLSPTGGPANV